MAASMLEGNRIHDELKQQNLLKHVNLNVPEALIYSGKQTKNMIEWVILYHSIFDGIKYFIFILEK